MHIPHENSTTAPETRTPANGSSLNVLRRSRSAPTLASGQLSYADILKASIKATSAPSLPTGSSGYVSLPSLESSPAVSPHPSPIGSSSSSGSSPQVLLSNPSSAEPGNQRSRWTVSLTPTRTMKPLRRLVLKNSKSDNNLRDRIDKAQMSAPMRSLLSSFQPISAGAGAGVGTGSNSSSHAEECGQVETKDCTDNSRQTELEHRKEVLSKDAVDTMGLSEKEAEVEETIVPRAMSVQQGKASAGMESVEALRDSNASASTATSTATATGLSFFRPPEELDELESSPETVRHAQNIVAVSMLKFEHQEDSTNTSEDGSKRRQSKDSDGSISNTLVPLGEKSSIPEHASAFLVERKKDAPAAAAAGDDEQEDDRQVDLSETLQSTSQKGDDGRPLAAISISDPTSPECPFQKQLALQEQEQLQVGTQAQEDLDDISSQQSKTATVTETAIATTTTTTTRGERLKQRRRRNNSSGGKKILPKKKTSATNLHSNVVQTLQQQKQSSLKAEDDNGSVENATTLSNAPATEDHIIPPFYFPMGRPLTVSKRRQKVLNALAKAREVFASAENEVLNEAGFVAVTVQCCELPRYMNRALFRKVDVAGNNEVRFSELELAWKSLAEGCPDEISMIFMILKQPNKNVLTPTDFEVVLQDLVLFHPGLEFLSGNAVFQERYLETVITRIFYEANRRHGKMSLADLRRSQFDKTLRKLENSDLNQTEDCFSYKHFYVIYCKFWELDQDHDLILDEQDLAGYSGGAISSRIIRRVMQGYGNETGMFMVPDQELLLQQQQQQQQQQHQQLMLMQQRQLQQQDLDLELELEKTQEQEQELEHGQSAEQQPVPSSSEYEAQQSSATKSLEHPENTPSADGSKTTLETVEASLDGSAVQQPKALRRSMTLSSVDLASIESADHATTTFNQTDTDIEMSSECDMATSAADTAITTATSPLTATTAWTAAAAAATAAAAAATTTPFVRTTPPGPGSQCHPQNYRMTYKGFIWFLLAETDKQTTTSIEYWFRCMDLDGDGMLTVFELEQLFQEQATRMAILGMESFGFRDAICQMQDLVSPKEPGLVRLTDLKQCGQAGPFIDLFCNVVRWRSFEAHQHQIRMRQQQIAMQRAADAAWEEGEKLFNSVVDDDDDEEEGDDSDQDRDEDAGSGEDDNNEDDDHSVSDQDEHEGDSVSEADEEGDEICSVKSDDADGLLRNSTAGDEIPMAKVAEGQQQDALLSPTAMAAAAAVKQKALKRRRRVQEKRQRKQQRQQQRQEQMLMKRVLLEEQRKEKALLATIRESPWIVYVESEYEKLVTIERPQSRTEWDQEEDDDEEEEDEEMEEEEEEEEVMDEEDMMMEEGRESSAASLQHQQHLQLQHQQFLLQQQQQLRLEQEQQLQLHQLQEGFSSQIEADVVLSDGDVGLVIESTKTPSHDSHKMTVGTGTLIEVGQDFEQISMDSHSMETNGTGVVAIGDVA
ncbi:Serine/threonine-protein phosphatase 2A regulatory subunit B'' subunit alpha [Mortierella antarctica]|nr:Serine/threonine-protein phosphatase 2A regulatory subunit B'' subunit alpha [Mortierella antarctica]